MHRTRDRVRLTTAAGIAALARGAVPASADSDGCSGAAAENAAPTGPDGVLALLAAGAVVLVATGGGLVAIGRRVER
jgi:hypothetical protein